MKKLTKKEVVQFFMDAQKFNHNDIKYPLGDDKIANREMWFAFIDNLCKNGIITEYQYNNWSVPRLKYFR